MKKGWLIGCGIAAVLAIGLCAGVGFLFFRGIFALTQPVVDASEQFLALLGQGKTADAYASTADGFRAQLDEASFSSAVQRLGLAEYASATWHSRQFENLEGSVEGNVTTKDGGKKPVGIDLIHENGQWKVLRVRFGGVDLTSAQPRLPLPTEEELGRMVTASLLEINKAFQSGDFTNFHGLIAERWKQETTPEKLRETFQDFVDKKVDLSPIENLQPRLTPPDALSSAGFLVVKGHYPTQPSRLSFELEYVQERGEWKMVAIGVNVAEAADE